MCLFPVAYNASTERLHPSLLPVTFVFVSCGIQHLHRASPPFCSLLLFVLLHVSLRQDYQLAFFLSKSQLYSSNCLVFCFSFPYKHPSYATLQSLLLFNHSKWSISFHLLHFTFFNDFQQSFGSHAVSDLGKSFLAAPLLQLLTTFSTMRDRLTILLLKLFLFLNKSPAHVSKMA